MKYDAWTFKKSFTWLINIIMKVRKWRLDIAFQWDVNWRRRFDHHPLNVYCNAKGLVLECCDDTWRLKAYIIVWIKTYLLCWLWLPYFNYQGTLCFLIENSNKYQLPTVFFSCIHWWVLRNVCPSRFLTTILYEHSYSNHCLSGL